MKDDLRLNLKMLLAGLFVSGILFYGCASADTDVKQGPLYHDSASTLKVQTFDTKPLLIKDDDEGWGADIRMSITEIKTIDTGTVYKVNAEYNNNKIGFEITAPLKKSGKLTLRSIGVASDSFISVFARLYKQKVKADARFVNSVTATCIDLGEYIDSLYQQSGQKYVKMNEYKVFLEGKNDDDYAEFFLNINDTDHWIEIAEKDEEYRPVIIRLLSGN